MTRIDPAMAAAFRRLGASLVADALGPLAAAPALRPLHGDAPMAGPAFTVETRPGDNLLVQRAIDLAAPGDVIVVAAGGETGRALIGEIMTTYARSRGVAGFVIDGAARDLVAIRRLGFPVFARGATPRGPGRDGPGRLGVPVTVDGALVRPGDLVLGDADGLVIAPAERAAAALEAARAREAAEAETLRRIEAGTLDRSWVEARLKEQGLL